MQPTSNTSSQPGYQPTNIIASTSSTNGNALPVIRTAENKQGNVTVRRDEDSSEESMEEEAGSDKTNQLRPSREETHEKAAEQGQPQQPVQGSPPRYIEPSASTITTDLSPRASASSNTAQTSDAPQPVVDSSVEYRLQLQEWIGSAHDVPMASRQKVKAKIEKYLHSPEKQEWTLRFSALDLETVPPLPSDLKRLKVNHNQLSALPEHLPVGLQWINANGNELSALPEHLPANLQEFYISDNELTALPEHLPAGLQVLYVNHNQLSALPEHLPAGLQELDASNNQLSSLPEHLPAGLQTIDVGDNQLSSLPLCLLNVGGSVDLSNNPLSITVLALLQQITNAPDYRGPRIMFSMAADEAPLTLDSVRPLTDAIQNWLGKESTPQAAFVQEQGATEFSLFLDKLAQSIVGRDPVFRTTFQSWLREMALHSSLRAHVFAVARGATASCQDRVMLTANDMAKARLLFQVERGDYDQRLPELIDIARGMFRLEKLEAIARKKAQSLKLVDEIEVYLAYQVKLRGPLRLPLVVGEMAYFKISGVSEQDLLAAEATVKELENREFRDFLLTWQPWQKALKGGRGASEETTRAHQFALWYMEYEQPLARLEEAIEAIDRQLNNGSASTTSGTGQTDRLQLERQALTAQRNALVSGARALSDDIARRVAGEGNVELPMSASLLDPVWDNDGAHAPPSSDAITTGFHAKGT
jgi:hypothetical protein